MQSGAPSEMFEYGKHLFYPNRSSTLKDHCTNSKVLKGFFSKGGIEKEVVLLVMKGEMAKEAEKKVRKWWQQIKVME